jgi:hypothetical protein
VLHKLWITNDILDVPLVYEENKLKAAHRANLSSNRRKMDYICKHYKFGYCKLKDKCEKYHVKEECRDGIHCKAIKACPLRHPKMCRRIVLEGLCGFGEKCSYNHKTRLNIHGDDIHEDVKKLREEVKQLKITLEEITSIQSEGEILKDSIKELEEDIKLLKTSNKALVNRITELEEDLTDKSFEESNSFVHENQIKETTLDLKCFKCDFVAHTELSLKKHINTKHGPKYDQLDNPEKSDANETECCFEGFEDIEDMFQLEIVEDEQVFACNICNESFDKHDKIKNHIKEDHKEIIIQIRKHLDK